MRIIGQILAILAVLVSFSTPGAAQFESLAFAVCKKIPADTARLKCFDEIGAKTAVAASEEPQLIKGKWVYTESRSPVDDSPQIVAALLGDGQEKILIFRCQENRTDAVFLPGAFFFSSNNRVEVLMRLNSDTPTSFSMIPGTNNRSLFVPAPSAFMRLLPDNAKLFFRATLANGERADATFELADVSAARDRIAETCHWTTPKAAKDKPGTKR
jgi:hypothetical protein